MIGMEIGRKIGRKGRIGGSRSNGRIGRQIGRSGSNRSNRSNRRMKDASVLGTEAGLKGLKLFMENIAGAVIRGVVHHDQLKEAALLSDDGIHGPPHAPGSVPGRDDDGNHGGKSISGLVLGFSG
jgi:hypothetical protein